MTASCGTTDELAKINARIPADATSSREHPRLSRSAAEAGPDLLRTIAAPIWSDAAVREFYATFRAHLRSGNSPALAARRVLPTLEHIVAGALAEGVSSIEQLTAFERWGNVVAAPGSAAHFSFAQATARLLRWHDNSRLRRRLVSDRVTQGLRLDTYLLSADALRSTRPLAELALCRVSTGADIRLGVLLERPLLLPPLDPDITRSAAIQIGGFRTRTIARLAQSYGRGTRLLVTLRYPRTGYHQLALPRGGSRAAQFQWDAEQLFADLEVRNP